MLPPEVMSIAMGRGNVVHRILCTAIHFIINNLPPHPFEILGVMMNLRRIQINEMCIGRVAHQGERECSNLVGRREMVTFWLSG